MHSLVPTASPHRRITAPALRIASIASFVACCHCHCQPSRPASLLPSPVPHHRRLLLPHVPLQ
ncbi:uncharacterized protein MYCFIDRAFT_209779 [Pseudocercospora fijiensis CIRAD86]|uniref:Uncharacterized protein n=1 Tax=Pseudocercospora fijiensis (strain CIRAD86) TaxID=383855 RepID=N1Q6Z2_PSEFD|nr:uncharacterized protein MYCFIDRAFT_209779 [Pseudocercospora fijiensis CIRAD86]EME88340.1 hypothetical protein MYCFIDRAFT_209779 [Pseudocercospora fijiensis CIRAD86]